MTTRRLGRRLTAKPIYIAFCGRPILSENMDSSMTTLRQCIRSSTKRFVSKTGRSGFLPKMYFFQGSSCFQSPSTRTQLAFGYACEQRGQKRSTNRYNGPLRDTWLQKRTRSPYWMCSFLTSNESHTRGAAPQNKNRRAPPFM